FFQAEDGIRDDLVTGVQTCALPIYYTEKMGASFSDEHQQKKPIVMGCYGIGVSRLVATAIEQHHDADGIRWPMSVAPFHVHICRSEERRVGKECRTRCEGE